MKPCLANSLQTGSSCQGEGKGHGGEGEGHLGQARDVQGAQGGTGGGGDHVYSTGLSKH